MPRATTPYIVDAERCCTAMPMLAQECRRRGCRYFTVPFARGMAVTFHHTRSTVPLRERRILFACDVDEAGALRTWLVDCYPLNKR